MTRNLVLYFCLSLVFHSCISFKQNGIVNLIIYDDFINPKQSYDLITEDFLTSGLIDSIKIKGRPIFENTINFRIDTLRANRFGIQLVELNNFLDSIRIKVQPDKLLNQTIELSGGQKIPISSVCEVYLELQAYKPELYLPDNECYRFNNECVVKVELYCRSQNKNKIVNYLQANMHKFTDNFTNETWRYEIIKGELVEESQD